MLTKMPADLKPGDKIAVQGGGYVVVSRIEDALALVSAGAVEFPAIRVHWQGGARPQLADPRTPVEVLP